MVWKNGAETEKAEIGKAVSLTVDEACKAILEPTPGLKKESLRSMDF